MVFKLRMLTTRGGSWVGKKLTQRIDCFINTKLETRSQT